MVVTAAAAPGAAQTVSNARVLVMPFAVQIEPGAPGGEGAALWLGEAAPTLLVEGLVTRGIEAVSRGERVAAFADLNIPMSSALTRATTLRVGELIGATDVVFGEIRLGTEMVVRARLVHLGAGSEVVAIEQDGALEDIFGVFAGISSRLAGQFPGAFEPPAAPPSSMALGTFETYLKGLVASSTEVRQRFLEAAVREAPQEPRILMALWDLYTALGLHDRALASANAVSSESWMHRRSRFAVALSMIDLGRFEGASATLRTLHDERPSPAISALLGIVQMRQGRLVGADSAVSYFHQAVIEAPGDPDHLFNLGYAYARAGQTDDALMWLREVVRVDAGARDAHLGMSALLASVGRTAESERERELARLLGEVGGGQAAWTSTGIPEGLERLPHLADLSSTSVRANVAASPGQRDQQETARFHLANARRLVEEDREREAEGELRRAIYLAPYEEEPHRLIGGIHLRAGRLGDAIEAFTVALWCRETVAGRIGLARALFENGQREAAQREAHRALVLEPGSVEAREIYEAATQ
jgi:tetratricopeptide (TPR) repeat protein